MRTYAMDIERRERRIFACMVALGVLILGYMAVRTAGHMGFIRGYNYAMETIID